MTSEAIFTAAREQHPFAERIEVKYLLAASAYTFDDGFHDWDEIISHYGDEIGQECRVIEVAVAHFRGGAFRFVFGADVTDAAEKAVWEADNAEYVDPYAEHRLTGSSYGLTRVAGRF